MTLVKLKELEGWRGGKVDRTGRGEKVKIKEGEGARVAPSSAPLGVPLPWPDSRSAPVWVEPTKASPLPNDTPLSCSPTTTLIRQV